MDIVAIRTNNLQMYCATHEFIISHFPANTEHDLIHLPNMFGGEKISSAVA